MAVRLRRGSLACASALLDVASDAIRLLPPRARYVPADLVAALIAALWTARRSIAEQNLAALLGAPAAQPRVRGLARASFRNFARMATDFLAVRTMSAAEVLAWVEPVGEPHLATALQAGRGVIFALPHVGSWDVAAAFAAAYGCPITIVTENSWASELVAPSRAGQGITLVPRSRSLRPLFRALARNEAVVLLGDLARPGLPTRQVAFFGRPAPLPIGPARLSLHTGAPVLVVSSVRLPDGHYRVEVQPALRADPALAPEQAVVELTARIATGFERVIAAHPEQWYPFSPIWPARSAGRATRP